MRYVTAGIIQLSRELSKKERKNYEKLMAGEPLVLARTDRHLGLDELQDPDRAVRGLRRVKTAFFEPIDVTLDGTLIWRGPNGAGEIVRVRDGEISVEPFSATAHEELWKEAEKVATIVFFSYPASAWTSNCDGT